jgi:thiamine-phosphate pyrophosphorylase
VAPQKKFDPSLYLVTDLALAAGRPLDEIVRGAIEGGVTMVQYRDKRSGTRAMIEGARAALAVAREAGCPLLINDRVDVALATDADGVHLGQEDMSVAAARSLLGPRRILGATADGPVQAAEAERAGADYIGCNAVFPTATKSDTGLPLGLEGLRRLVASTALPVVAIGGVNRSNAADLLDAGAAGLAVVSAIMGATDPRLAARELAATIAAARG